MLRLLSRTPGRLCDGTSRRECLRLAGDALALWSGAHLIGSPVPAQAAAPRARSVVLFSLWGGPSHLDTFDLKPDAPAEIRGEFAAIPAPVDGLRICEHLPRLARLARRYAVVRSVSHADNGHGSGLYTRLTGWPHPQVCSDANPTPADHPPLGTVIGMLRPPRAPVPPFVVVGNIQANLAGQTAGFLGQSHAPFVLDRDASAADFAVPGLSPLPEVPEIRLARRERLLDGVETTARKWEQAASTGLSHLQSRALELLTSRSLRAAFDLSAEPDTVRDRYGRHPVGQNLLLTRRLVEAGVPAIQVSWNHRGPWDTHGDNFNSLRGSLLPRLDESLSAFLEDLHDRGLLDGTLVMAAGEFGRTPKINELAGRDHWAPCYSALLAGGGIQAGRVWGASDEQGAYPATDPVGPWDLAATVLHLAGIDPRAEFRDQEGRPQRVCPGRVVEGLL